jgi:hypothetical protein
MNSSFLAELQRRPGISAILLGSRDEGTFSFRGFLIYTGPRRSRLNGLGSVRNDDSISGLLPGGTDRRFAQFSMTETLLFQSIIHVKNTIQSYMIIGCPGKL